MNELIEGMLSISSWFSPDDRTGAIGYTATITGHIFPVRFHVTLLEVGCKAM